MRLTILSLHLVMVVLANEVQQLENKKSFLYFGYGSNLLTKRIHKNTCAIRAGIGKLQNYRLDFDAYSNRWHGYVATIVPNEDSHVWGAIWKINSTDLDGLDRQEGVDEKMYFRFSAKVEKPDGTVTDCYTYQLVNNPKEYFPLDKLPLNRQPSKAYLDVIIKGAEESELPIVYQTMLKNIVHNDYNGQVFYNISK